MNLNNNQTAASERDLGVSTHSVPPDEMYLAETYPLRSQATDQATFSPFYKNLSTDCYTDDESSAINALFDDAVSTWPQREPNLQNSHAEERSSCMHQSYQKQFPYLHQKLLSSGVGTHGTASGFESFASPNTMEVGPCNEARMSTKVDAFLPLHEDYQRQSVCGPSSRNDMTRPPQLPRRSNSCLSSLESLAHSLSSAPLLDPDFFQSTKQKNKMRRCKRSQDRRLRRRRATISCSHDEKISKTFPNRTQNQPNLNRSNLFHKDRHLSTSQQSTSTSNPPPNITHLDGDLESLFEEPRIKEEFSEVDSFPNKDRYEWQTQRSVRPMFPILRRTKRV
ncbi:uncharacterized protein LOC144747568 [Ciona intestinalis]